MRRLPAPWSSFVFAPLRALALSLSLSLALSAGAAPLAWDALKPEEQALLAPLKEQWPQLSEARQQRWRGVAADYSQKPAADQQRLQQRLKEWGQLSPEERHKARANYRAAREQHPEHAERNQRWSEYQKLSPEEKARLRHENTQRKKP